MSLHPKTWIINKKIKIPSGLIAHVV